MIKIFKLIKNEMIKLFKRRSIWVMLAITVLVAMGAAKIYEITAPADAISDDEATIEGWKQEIERLEYFFEKDHYLEDAYADNSFRAREARNRSEMLQYLVNNGYSPSDWRYKNGVINDMFYQKLQMDTGYEYDRYAAEYERIKAIVDADDWKTYYKYQMDIQFNKYLNTYPEAADEIRDAVTFEYNYRIERDLKPGEEKWRDDLIASVVSAKLSLAYYAQQECQLTDPNCQRPSKGDPELSKPNLDSMEQVKEGRASVNDKLAVALYRLENEVETDLGYVFGEELVLPYGENSNFWESFASSSEYIFAVGILVIVIAGLIVSTEFSSGTIKFLLVSPVKRWKIVISKYVTVMAVGAVLTLILYLSSIAASLIFLGGNGFDNVIVKVENGIAWGESPFLRVLADYGWSLIEVVVVATMAFALSSLMRSAAVSVGVGLFAYLSGSVIVELFASAELDFGRYILFANLDLPSIIAGNSMFPNQTVVGAVVNIALYMAVFILTAWDGFVRKEI